MDDLRSLIAASLARDTDAYGQLVRRFQQMAHGYACSILNDWALSEDAAQEAFLEAYWKLADLRTPDAFPGWLRRIVFKHCDRLVRGKRVSTVCVDHAAQVAAGTPTPDAALDEQDQRDTLLAAVRSLPDDEREAVTLFYLGCHSHKEVAAFLDVPVSTVKSRLHTARAKLRGRMLTVMRDAFKEHGVDERFSRKVIDAILAQPRPLMMAGHPVHDVFQAIRQALPDYEVLADSDEVVTESAMMNPWCLQFAYHPDDQTILRTETMHSVFTAATSQQTPVHLIAAGRVFQSPQADEYPIRHELNLLCIEPGADEAAMKATVGQIMEAAIGVTDLTYDDATFHWFSPCCSVSTRTGGKQLGLAGCGVLTPDTLRQFGHDPDQVGGFAIAIGQLDRLAAIKLGIPDADALWREPYV